MSVAQEPTGTLELVLSQATLELLAAAQPKRLAHDGELAPAVVAEHHHRTTG